MKIGLIPVSAKPYHSGHHKLVEIASGENDLVFLFVSTSDRNRKGEFEITGKKMLEVWKSEIEPIIPCNVSIEYGGSPVRKVYEAIGNACENNSDDEYTIYSDPIDTEKNYSLKNRAKYMQPLYDLGQVIFAAENDPASFTRGDGTPDTSGTLVRKYLSSGDLEKFSTCMPKQIDCEKVFNILTKK